MADALAKTCVFATTRKATEALAANRFVAHGGGYPANDGDVVMGVTAAAAKSGENVAVDVLGIAVVKTTAAAIAVGDRVLSDDEGQAYTHASNGTLAGRALSAVGASGGMIQVLLIPS